jgi:hypothetical protein
MTMKAKGFLTQYTCFILNTFFSIPPYGRELRAFGRFILLDCVNFPFTEEFHPMKREYSAFLPPILAH